jgi:hypothetical protein
VRSLKISDANKDIILGKEAEEVLAKRARHRKKMAAAR